MRSSRLRSLQPLDWLKSNHLAALIFGLAAAFVAGGVAYWRASGTWSPYHCFYGDANCSLAFATYLLCFLTALAFLAALYAAKTAFRTYNMERSTILAERSCPHIEHQAHVSLVLTRQLTFQDGEPDREERGVYYIPFDYDFENLGRSPITDAFVQVEFQSEGTRQRQLVSIGSIRRDGHVHARVYVWSGHVRGILQWLRKDACYREVAKMVSLDFRPSQAQRTGFLAATPLLLSTEPLREPPIRVPAQPPDADAKPEAGAP